MTWTHQGQLVMSEPGLKADTVITHTVYDMVEEDVIGYVISTSNHRRWHWVIAAISDDFKPPFTGYEETPHAAADAMVKAYRDHILAPYRDEEDEN